MFFYLAACILIFVAMVTQICDAYLFMWERNTNILLNLQQQCTLPRNFVTELYYPIFARCEEYNAYIGK